MGTTTTTFLRAPKTNKQMSLANKQANKAVNWSGVIKFPFFAFMFLFFPGKFKEFEAKMQKN